MTLKVSVYEKDAYAADWVSMCLMMSKYDPCGDGNDAYAADWALWKLWVNIIPVVTLSEVGPVWADELKRVLAL